MLADKAKRSGTNCLTEICGLNFCYKSGEENEFAESCNDCPQQGDIMKDKHGAVPYQ